MTSLVIRWVAFIVALGAFCLAAWIVVPAPTYFLLTFGVGAREVSAWIAVASIAAIGLAATSVRGARLSEVSIAFGVVSFALAISPFARLPATVTRFDREMRPMSAEPAVPLHAKPLVVADLFRGIPLARVVVARGVQFASAGGVPLALDVYRPPTPARAAAALMVSYSSPPLNIRGVISFYGPAELVDAYKHPPRPDPLDVRATMDTLFGGTLDQMPDRYAAGSPATLATKRQPPTLLVYGGADHVVQAKYGALLRDTLAAHDSVAHLEIPWASMRSTPCSTGRARSCRSITSSVFSRGLQLAQNLRLDLLVLRVIEEPSLAHLVRALKPSGGRSAIIVRG
ncbi:MAG TPA: hypothetical protein VHV78_05890, partial [Gemmatimonadaceae bacterium]|nr:hypothetical protein [Gemmatimonadaceae bacterium]